ncbi:MAG: nucleotidyltransferase family protein [Chloroflexi bacterium]|nr:nucleotidyltransferase family protein [Chloroflexota bacterium]
MTVQQLVRHAREIRQLGAQHGAVNVRVFGSYGRGNSGPSSDLDLLVQMEPGRSLLDLVGFQQDVADLLGIPVDVVTEHGLSRYIRDSVLADARPL